MRPFSLLNSTIAASPCHWLCAPEDNATAPATGVAVGVTSASAVKRPVCAPANGTLGH